MSLRSQKEMHRVREAFMGWRTLGNHLRHRLA